MYPPMAQKRPSKTPLLLLYCLSFSVNSKLSACRHFGEQQNGAGGRCIGNKMENRLFKPPDDSHQ